MLTHSVPKFKLVEIFIYEGKAYLPRPVKVEGGGSILFEPVLVARINSDEIAEAVKEIYDLEEMTIPRPKTREEFKAYPDVIMIATKARSWKRMSKQGMYADIVWINNEIYVNVSKSDKQGWAIDSEKEWVFPMDTPLTAIVDVILQDYQGRNFQETGSK